jgi:hypothetical protein
MVQGEEKVLMSEAKENPRCLVHYHMIPDGQCSCPHDCQDCGVTYVGGHSKDECVTVLKRRLRLNELAAKIEALSVGRESMSNEELVAAARADLLANLQPPADVKLPMPSYYTPVSQEEIESEIAAVHEWQPNSPLTDKSVCVACGLRADDVMSGLPSAEPPEEEVPLETCVVCSGSGKIKKIFARFDCIFSTAVPETVVRHRLLAALMERDALQAENKALNVELAAALDNYNTLLDEVVRLGTENGQLKHTVADLSAKIAKLSFEASAIGALPPMDVTDEDRRVSDKRGYIAPEWQVLEFLACRERQLRAAREEVLETRLAFMLSDAILPEEFEPELPPTKRLHAYIANLHERMGKAVEKLTELYSWQ